MRNSRRSSILLGGVIAVFVCLANTGASAAGLTISGNVTLTINSATHAGGALAPDSDSTTYAVVNALGTKKIVGRLNTAMPSGTTLRVQLAAPAGATSAGAVTLTASDRDLVTGIGVVVETGLDMSFTLSAVLQAGVVNTATRTLTFTLIDTP